MTQETIGDVLKAMRRGARYDDIMGAICDSHADRLEAAMKSAPERVDVAAHELNAWAAKRTERTPDYYLMSKEWIVAIRHELGLDEGDEG